MVTANENNRYWNHKSKTPVFRSQVKTTGIDTTNKNHRFRVKQTLKLQVKHKGSEIMRKNLWSKVKTTSIKKPSDNHRSQVKTACIETTHENHRSWVKPQIPSKNHRYWNHEKTTCIETTCEKRRSQVWTTGLKLKRGLKPQVKSKGIEITSANHMSIVKTIGIKTPSENHRSWLKTKGLD